MPAAGAVRDNVTAVLIVIGNVPDLVACGELESFAVTLIVVVPLVVGVPVIEQLFVAELRPAGRLVIVQLYGPVPPLTPTLLLYGVPTVPFAAGPVKVSTTGAALTTRVTGPFLVKAGLLESVAVTCRVEVPATVGVPVIRQLLAFRPAGRPVITQL